MNDIVTLQRDGARLLAEGSITERIKRFKDAHCLDPFNSGLLFNLAAVMHNIGQHEAADRHFRRAMLCDPTFARAYGHIVALDAKTSGPASAHTHIRRLVCLVPLSSQTLALATQYLFELGRHEAVRSAAHRSLVIEPRAAGLCRLMGLSASHLQHIEDASIALSRASMLQPNWADARLALAGAKFARHDFEGALHEATTAVTLGGYQAEGAFWQARASLALHRIDDADRYFASAVALEPIRQVSAGIARLTLNQWDFQRFHNQANRDA